MKKIPLFKKQIEFLSYTNEREVLFEAGIAYGKTFTGALWLANQVLLHPNSIWIMVARDAGQLVDATDAAFYDVLTDVMGLVEGYHFKRIKSPRINYKFANNVEVRARSAHNYDSSFRGPNYWGGWGDEIDFWKAEALDRLRGRIRIGTEQLRFTSSPFGFNHVWDDFYNKKIGKVVNAKSMENPLLSKAYLDSLKRTYSPRLYEQEVLAKRLRLNAGSVYSEFNRDAHVKPCRDILEEGDEIFFFTDYNIANYCGVYTIKKDGVVYILGEEHLKFKSTEEMAKIVYSKFPKHSKIVVGDSTGNNKKDVAITRTNYAQFEAEGLLTKKFRNPPVQARIINANSRLHHNLVVVDTSCTTLIKDLELVSWKEDGSDIDKSNINLSHASDAWSYSLWYHLPLKKPDPDAKIRLY